MCVLAWKILYLRLIKQQAGLPLPGTMFVFGRGKSGQRRAFRFLTGSNSRGLVSAEENNRRCFVHRSSARVRRRGKSPPAGW